MDEADFWVSLEFRLCEEFAGLPERRSQYFWCDGLDPSQYMLEGPSPRIKGLCWICNGPQQAEWEFVLLLPRPFGSPKEIDWASFLPPGNVTRWMAFDEGRRYLEIEPAVAVPDLAEAKRGRAKSERAKVPALIQNDQELEGYPGVRVGVRLRLGRRLRIR